MKIGEREDEETRIWMQGKIKEKEKEKETKMRGEHTIPLLVSLSHSKILLITSWLLLDHSTIH